MERKNLKYIISGGAVVSSLLARHLLTKGWTKVAGRKPPINPAANSVKFGEALAWTLALSIVGGLSNLAFRKLMGEKTGNKTR